MYPVNKFNKICQLFCLAPISSNPNTQHVLSAYSWATISGLILITACSFTTNVYGDGFVVSSLVTSAVFLTVVAGHIVAILESLVKREDQHKFFSKLQVLDDIFRLKLQHKVPIQQLRRKLVLKYFLLSSVIMFAFVFNIGCILTYDYEGFFWPAMISLIATRIRFIQASTYVDLVTCRFDHLNYLLKQIAYCRLPRRNILDVDYRIIDNPDRISVLKCIYAKLYDIVQCLNDIFGWSILAILVYYCLDFTCNIYWLFLTFERYESVASIFENFATILPIGLLFVLYCITCYECVCKSYITKQLVQEILESSPLNHIHYLLDAFLIQIEHLPIDIHVKRFFSINLKLLISIGVSITGYLVILIQFLYAENSP